MASIVNEEGLQVDPVGSLDVTREVTDRFRDMMMVRFRKMNLSAKSIANLLGTGRHFVERRLKEIPADVREYYLECPALEALVNSRSEGAPA